MEDSLNINKHKILAAIKGLIGEQRIDLSIISKPTLTNEVFYRHVITTAIKLSNPKA